MEESLSRADIINALNLSVHGKFEQYVPIISRASKQDPEFVAHLIAWDFINGQIKDTKTALPVITLMSRDYPDELVENSVAHLALQPPRELAKALRFSIASGTVARRQRALEKMIRRYLAFKEREPGKWNRMAIRHRRSLRELYVRSHATAPSWASMALFGFERSATENIIHRELRRKMADLKSRGELTPEIEAEVRAEIAGLKHNLARPVGSIFADIAALSRMEPSHVAATIQKWHLAPIIVTGAMSGSKAKQDDSAVVQASMGQMSDTEIVKHARKLEDRHGIAKDASLKETFRRRVAKATTSKKATLKTSVAAEEVEDESMKDMLRELQERQIEAQKNAGRGIDGNWLVICDRSQSQGSSIQLGIHIAAAIAKFVTRSVWLAFCNNEATIIEATGKDLETLRLQARFIRAAGGTSYGVGLEWAISKGLSIDGVAIVGDGGENSDPIFAHMHAEYKRKYDKSLPVYLYQTFVPPMYANGKGDPRRFGAYMQRAGLTFTKFDLTSGAVDFYSLPNLVATMNVSRFGVVEKIMAAPFLTIEQVLPIKQLCSQ